MSPKKHQLVVQPHTNALLTGIVSQLPDYQLVHFLNKRCDVHLVRMTDIAIMPVKGTGTPSEYHFFSGKNETYGFTACLVPNPSGGGSILPTSLKNIDYLLFLLDPSERYDQQGFLKQIRSIQGVLLAQVIPLGKLAGIDHVLGSIELHLMNINQ